MGMFEMSEEQVATYRDQLRGYAEEKVAESVVAAAILRRGGVATRMGISHGGLGGIAYWVAIVGGIVFVIAALATDMFGLGSGY